MDLWSVLEERITQHGVRVDERLELLGRLKTDNEMGGASVADRKATLVSRVEEAAASLKETLRA